jgi:hypothetical protein
MSSAVREDPAAFEGIQVSAFGCKVAQAAGFAKATPGRGRPQPRYSVGNSDGF